MATEMPKAADLFDGATPYEAAQKMEEYTDLLGKSLSNASHVPGQAPTQDPMAAMEALAASKSLTADAAAGLGHPSARSSDQGTEGSGRFDVGREAFDCRGFRESRPSALGGETPRCRRSFQGRPVAQPRAGQQPRAGGFALAV